MGFRARRGTTMSLWEYKVITSGKGGFATPALLEKFLNDLGRDEWEIVEFRTAPDNILAFSGLARRTTQRDWTLQDAAAAAAKAEAEKLRAEFEAKFKAATTTGGGGGAPEERSPSFIEEKVAGDDGFRKPVDTSHDAEPEDDEEAKADEWDKLTEAEEDELPTFFEAIRPHMRRNQRGPGMSVGVDYLAKKWDQAEEDLKGALVECGFAVPADEDAKAEYVEYDGDLYWININRRGEMWINMKEKPRPVFKSVKAQRVAIEEPAKQEKPEKSEEKAAKTEEGGAKPEAGTAKSESSEAGAAQPEGEKQNGKQQGAPSGGKLPEGTALLDKIRPHMRRNRRGPGGSGSTSFLSRALRVNEADLRTAFTALGLTVPASPNDRPVYTEIGNEVWWLNSDSRGGLWINGREKKQGEVIGASATEAGAPAPEAAVTPSPETGGTAPAEAGTSAAPSESAPAQAAPEAVPAPEAAPSAPVAVEPVIPATQFTTSPFEISPKPAAIEPAAPPPAQAEVVAGSGGGGVLASVRLLLKETKTGSIAGKVDRVAEELGKSPDDLVTALVGAGMKVPEKPREKPVFVEYAGEILWLNRNAKGELWLNAKASKFADKADVAEDEEEGEESSEGDGAAGDGEKKPARRGGRSKKKED